MAEKISWQIAGQPTHAHLYEHRRTYRDLCTRTHQEQAQLLESKRYKTYPKWMLEQRVMQRLGDFGRRYMPVFGMLRFR